MSPWPERQEVNAPSGGATILRLVGDFLVSAGFTVTPAEVYEDYGWEITATKEKKRIWILIQYPEPWLLITKDVSGIFAKLSNGGKIVHLDACRAIQKLLTSDPRFSAPEWFTREQYEMKQAGASAPE